MLVSMTKPRGMRPTIRRLEAIGRFSAIPSELTIEQVIGDCSVPATGADPPLPELTETYQVVDAVEAVDPDTGLVSDRVAQALPHTAEGALSVSDLADLMNQPVRSVRHGLAELAGRVCRMGAGHRTDPYRFFITANPNLRGLGETEQKKGGQLMAFRANDRAPPEDSLSGVHENAGAENSGATK